MTLKAIASTEMRILKDSDQTSILMTKEIVTKAKVQTGEHFGGWALWLKSRRQNSAERCRGCRGFVLVPTLSYEYQQRASGIVTSMGLSFKCTKHSFQPQG